MTGFRILSLAAGLGLIAFCSYRRFRAVVPSGNEPFFLHLWSYGQWVGRALATFFRPEGWEKARSFYLAWLASYRRPWEKWALSGVLVSFSYLAASGFGFALLSQRGLFGLSLLLHVACGGIYSLCLSVLLVLRAKHYIIVQPRQALLETSSSILRSMSGYLLKPILFWLLVLSSFSLVLTAFLSMLPYFTFEAQLDILTIHRYSALIALIAAILFLDQTVVQTRN